MKRTVFLTISLPAYIILLGLTLPCLKAKAANQDSLRQVVIHGTDKEKLEAFRALAASLVTKDFYSATDYGRQGLQLALAEGDTTSAADFYNIIGEAQYFAGNYDTAARNFLTAARIYEQSHSRAKLANAYNNMAKLYRKTRDLDDAEAYYNKAMDLFVSLNDTPGMEMIWNESGVVYEYRGQYDEAIRRYQKALQMARATGNQVGVGYALNNISGSFLLQGRYEEAKSCLLQALALRKQIGDTFALAINYSDLGALFDTMRLYSQALQHFDTSNTLAVKLKYPQLLAHNYRLMSAVARKQGDHARAYEYYILADVINDSLYKVERLGIVDEINTRYQTEKREQQIKLQQLQISRRNYIIGGISLLLIMGGVLGYSIYSRAKLRHEARLQEELTIQRQLATQAVLEAEEKERQRIGQDLHDGVGQLMSAVKINLSGFRDSLKLDSEEERLRYDNIVGLVDESCSEVRSISHQMMPNALLKSGLASAVRDFLNKIDEKTLEVNLYTEGLNERLKMDVETVLYRIIQECVNNVIKHARARRLDISILRDEDGISATVEDDGVGFDTSASSEGIGLSNIRSRVEYLNGSVDFDSHPGRGTVVVIHIPA